MNESTHIPCFFGFVLIRVTSLHLLLAGTRRVIYAFNYRDRPVKNIIVSPTMSEETQRVRVEIGLNKPHADQRMCTVFHPGRFRMQGLMKSVGTCEPFTFLPSSQTKVTSARSYSSLKKQNCITTQLFLIYFHWLRRTPFLYNVLVDTELIWFDLVCLHFSSSHVCLQSSLWQ